MIQYYTQQQLRWLKRGAGISLFVILISVFLFHWQNTERQAKKVAIILMANTMQTNLNKLHQYWLLNRFPKQAVINSQSVVFDNNGWPIIAENSDMDCATTLSMLYPKNSVFGEKVTISRTLIKQDDVICRYVIKDSAQVLLLKNISLTVSAVFLT